MRPKLLLADDSITVQRVIELTFADEGLEVVSVGDGRQAIERIEQDRPDIVLADASMPEGDGYQVAAYVKRAPHLAHIPVVLMTGAFEHVDQARARAAGCDGVLAKPFDPQMAVSLVRQLLGRQAGEPASPAPPPVRPVPGPRPAGSLDEYLDELDQAFVASVGREADEAAAPAGPLAAEGRETPPPGPASLADAFSALLAEELGETPLPASWGAVAGAAAGAAGPPAAGTPGGAPAASAPALGDEVIDEIARRVAERLGEQALRDLVSQQFADIAERLVREEIERLKASAV
jgi:CheY-like chemotaxis protein